LGAAQRSDKAVSAWASPLLDAYIDGCWLLFWTKDTVYWAAKPTVHVDRTNGNRRLHNNSHAALESDIENLYFLDGVMVPAFVVVEPKWITMKHIVQEENAEVRRIMLDRFGWERFAEEGEFEIVHQDRQEFNFPAIPVSDMVDAESRLVTTYRKGIEIAQLLRSKNIMRGDGQPLTLVRITDPSTGRRYHLRVPPSSTTAYGAIAWTFGMTEDQYRNRPYIRQGDVGLIPLNAPGLNQQHS